MMLSNSLTVCVCLLGVLWWWNPPVQAQSYAQSVESVAQPISNLSNLTTALAGVDVVYLGETHDRPADHEAQLQLIQALHQQHPQLAIGMEMFQRPFQSVLDEYLAGTITETELRQRSQYDRRWGFPWEYYAPILQYAQMHQIPVLALNTPTEVTQRVARKGLLALLESDLQWVPPLTEIHTDDEAYRQFLRPVYDDFHHEHGSSQGFENFVAAQVLWDETMAETIANFWLTHPTHQVVVLAGQGHIMYGYGIPSRVDRRITEALEQRLILLNPEVDRMEESAIADFFWLSPD